MYFSKCETTCGAIVFRERIWLAVLKRLRITGLDCLHVEPAEKNEPAEYCCRARSIRTSFRQHACRNT